MFLSSLYLGSYNSKFENKEEYSKHIEKDIKWQKDIYDNSKYTYGTLLFIQANLYHVGSGVDEDLGKTISLLEQSAHLGSYQSAILLMKVYALDHERYGLDKPNLDKAIEYANLFGKNACTSHMLVYSNRDYWGCQDGMSRQALPFVCLFEEYKKNPKLMIDKTVPDHCKALGKKTE